MNWLTALEPGLVALVQLLVVTAALQVAKLARRRVRALESQLEQLDGDKSLKS